MNAQGEAEGERQPPSRLREDAPEPPSRLREGLGEGRYDDALPTLRARELRANATDAERRLWRQLSARKVAGIRFNRQVPIGPYVCDFVSRGAKLVVEVDGGQHDAGAERDARRTQYLEAHGYLVIRFWNNDVLGNIEGVVAELERVLRDLPSPNPSRKREGDRVVHAASGRGAG